MAFVIGAKNSTTIVTPSGTYVKFKSYSDILLAKSTLLNDFNPDEHFYERGEFSFDYVVSVTIGKESYALKLDLTSNIPYVVDIGCKT